MSDTSNIIYTFTADQAVRLTGLSMRQLAEWDRDGFFAPRYADDDRRSPYSRIYSFKDVVGLRTISLLKGRHGVSTPHLKDVARKLTAYSSTPWSDLRLRVWSRKVQFEEPETGQTVGVVDGQYMLLPIAEVIEEVRDQAQQMRLRDPATVGQIRQHRNVAHNAAVIAGTRIRVSTIERYLDAGCSAAAIMGEFPSLTDTDITAVRALARSAA